MSFGGFYLWEEENDEDYSLDNRHYFYRWFADDNRRV